MILIIVESPTKAAAITGYLGHDCKVMASRGHIREIRHRPFGVDVENDFRTVYEPVKGADKIVASLKKEAAKAERVLLASDPDREGEAIAWHLAEVLGIDPASPCRITYHEVTKEAVRAALGAPRPIDLPLAKAALARSILDYLVGFTVSPLLWQKLCSGLSAGRVQSAALYLVCEREKRRKAELLANQEPTHYTVDAGLSHEGIPFTVTTADLTKEEAERVLAEVEGKPFVLDTVTRSKEKSMPPQPPFKTSTLIRASLTNLGFGAEQTMRVAQSLFEGKDVGGETKGLITYMRTDSAYISGQFQSDTRTFLDGEFGPAYLPKDPPVYKAGGNAQEAHEAIRPTSLSLTPTAVAPYLSEEENALYKMIYGRYLASQMTPAVTRSVTYRFLCEGIPFTVSDTEIVFDGFRRVYDYAKKKPLPRLAEGMALVAEETQITPHYKAVVPHFNQASLVEYMEKCGIGRPSTYASTIRTLMDRGYAELDGRAIIPRDLGYVVNEGLTKAFPGTFSVTETKDGFESFTADLEEVLDGIACGKRDEIGELRRFWDAFAPQLENAKKTMPKYVPEKTELYCPRCGAPLLRRLSKSGLFYGCANFPACTYTGDIPEVTEELCKECGKPLIKRHRKNGAVFLICTNPDCSRCRRETEEEDGTTAQNADSKPAAAPPDASWKKQITVTQKAISLSKFGKRIEKAAQAAGAFDGKFSGQTLKNRLAKEGLLVLREDKYGNKGYLPTEQGTALGIGIEERAASAGASGKMEIAVLDKKAQQYVLEKLL